MTKEITLVKHVAAVAAYEARVREQLRQKVAGNMTLHSQMLELIQRKFGVPLANGR